MIVVSDTTAITTLLNMGEARLLAELFGEVAVPQGVWDELRAFHSDLPEFVRLRQVTRPGERLPGTETLGRGEAEALKLARELRADLLLMDDRRGRKAAASLGIVVAGLPDLGVRARRTGHLSSVRHFIEKLETKGGLYLSDSVKAEALRLAGE
jgi:predicted nucleic acid-binding protein